VPRGPRVGRLQSVARGTGLARRHYDVALTTAPMTMATSELQRCADLRPSGSVWVVDDVYILAYTTVYGGVNLRYDLIKANSSIPMTSPALFSVGSVHPDVQFNAL